MSKCVPQLYEKRIDVITVRKRGRSAATRREATATRNVNVRNASATRKTSRASK